MLFRRNKLAIAVALVIVQPIAASADPITIIDHEERTVTLARPAERIASIPIPIASTIIAMDGGTSKLVGMNPTAKSAIVEGVLGKIFPKAKDIPSDITAPNFIPNVEELATTNPDLVIQWADRGPDLVDPIVNAGLTALLISYGTEEKTKQYQAMVATAMGNPERAEMINGWRDQVVAEMAAKSKDIPAEQKPKILYLGRALEALTASGDKGNYNAFYINLVGATSASADVAGQGTTISPEQIAEWNPDVILLNSFEAKLGLERVYDDPILSLTKAAQKKRVYKLPLGGYRWDPPNQESPLTWMWLANLIHPDIFQYDLRGEMRQAYKMLYNYDLTGEDIDSILWVGMQGDATNYAQFKAK
ncbi:ABC transporter substrate-binding protein (plasmid) [Rhizobium sp. WL3]|uniref:ABC transporter substrate-binding protein n=1 Tax=Rhizobium sp. WL3 TaxID=2603277 RepID=UPI0011C1E5BD|nr:ABC transporter substrate-binding protein [Rhizobium sp. WL3]QEE43536.1 ABC transporter substrate-binding protein [Rhizobium sp. WL3]